MSERRPFPPPTRRAARDAMHRVVELAPKLEEQFRQRPMPEELFYTIRSMERALKKVYKHSIHAVLHHDHK